MQLPLVLLLLVGLTRAQESTMEPPPVIREMLESARGAVTHMRDATYLVARREWKGGKYLPYQEIAVKLRLPCDLYLRFVGESDKGMEVLYRPGWNQGRLRANPGRYMPNLDLDPRGSVAMRSSRQPVWMASIVRVVERILQGSDRLVANPTLDATYRILGARLVAGANCDCYEADLPKDQDPEQYARTLRLCLDSRLHLPRQVQAWDLEDGAMRLVEDYTFRDLRVDVGLTDQDFDPANPSYGFGR